MIFMSVEAQATESWNKAWAVDEQCFWSWNSMPKSTMGLNLTMGDKLMYIFGCLETLTRRTSN
jgi:hypothetical protein